MSHLTTSGSWTEWSGYFWLWRLLAPHQSCALPFSRVATSDCLSLMQSADLFNFPCTPCYTLETAHGTMAVVWRLNWKVTQSQGRKKKWSRQEQNAKVPRGGSRHEEKRQKQRCTRASWRHTDPLGWELGERCKMFHHKDLCYLVAICYTPTL